MSKGPAIPNSIILESDSDNDLPSPPRATQVLARSSPYFASSTRQLYGISSNSKSIKVNKESTKPIVSMKNGINSQTLIDIPTDHTITDSPKKCKQLLTRDMKNATKMTPNEFLEYLKSPIKQNSYPPNPPSTPYGDPDFDHDFLDNDLLIELDSIERKSSFVQKSPEIQIPISELKSKRIEKEKEKKLPFQTINSEIQNKNYSKKIQHINSKHTFSSPPTSPISGFIPLKPTDLSDPRLSGFFTQFGTGVMSLEDIDDPVEEKEWTQNSRTNKGNNVTRYRTKQRWKRR